jgi:hypothetical protein
MRDDGKAYLKVIQYIRQQLVCERLKSLSMIRNSMTPLSRHQEMR